MSESMTKETLGFQAEVAQLLHLMVHSLYGNKEIFLRELVSNASDAGDRLRFAALGDAALFESDPELKIHVSYDKAARTITVADNGIGMSRQEVVDHIGTIAKSGTREFFKSLSSDQARNAHLIGQFGVGFYSAFIVADRVTLVTRAAGAAADDGVRWESAGEGEYTVETVRKDTRGTDVTLHLRPEEDELLSGERLRHILRRYSDHITVPILMDGEQINQASALWARPKSDITEEQYFEFYKHVAHDFEPPLAYTHAKVEGRQEYTLLLFIPQHAPFDLWDRDHRHGLKLYVRRVFIMDDAEQLMPAYLRFVRGVIDSNDLPLNVSREILQQSRDIEGMRAESVRRVLGLVEGLAEKETEKFATFWSAFGRVLKEGVAEDTVHRARIAGLLRFSSTHLDSDEQVVSLAQYVGRMKDGQDAIYYVTADRFSTARNSPHLEVFRKLGVEVLLMYDRVDEWMLSFLTEFEGKALTSVARGGLDLSRLGEPAAREDEKSSERPDWIERIDRVLKDRVSAVRVSNRLTNSPACLVSAEQGMSSNLERMLKAAGQEVPSQKRVLEVNPGHPIVERLKEEPDEAAFSEWSRLLFDQALLAEGGVLDDPAAFVKRLNDLMLSLVQTQRP
jgi:molecular chaperone HtpG